MRKRNYAFFLLTALSLILATVVLPATYAKRNGKKAAAAQPKQARISPNTNVAALTNASLAAVPRQIASAPVSSRAVGFAVSPVIRDLPPPEQVKPDPEAEQAIKSNPNKIVRMEVENPVSVS